MEAEGLEPSTVGFKITVSRRPSDEGKWMRNAVPMLYPLSYTSYRGQYSFF